MFETADISLRGIAAGAALIAGGIAFSVCAALVFHQAELPVAPPSIAGPVLQTAPREELAAYRREKEAKLKSIERAMRELAK